MADSAKFLSYIALKRGGKCVYEYSSEQCEYVVSVEKTKQKKLKHETCKIRVQQTSLLQWTEQEKKRKDS